MAYVLLIISYMVFVFASNWFNRYSTQRNGWFFCIVILTYLFLSQCYLLGLSQLMLLWRRSSARAPDFGHANQLLGMFWIFGTLSMLGFLIKYFILHFRNRPKPDNL
jgi:ABC-type glycerol-3-phosphate transport system permease component